MTANIHARGRDHGWRVSFVRLFRVGLATLFFFMLPVAAEAYTLVLRSGRHVSVSDKFKVTPTAFTYEASPGYWVTVWLSNIDIAATERANGEPVGSFSRKIKREPEGARVAPAHVPEALQVGRGDKRKVVTNRDLEPARLTREAQEEEYERTRRGRGLPSRDEMRRRIEEQDRWLSEWAQRMQDERREAELESLKSELLNVRLQLRELSLSQEEAFDAPASALSYYYPYFYAPPFQVITVLNDRQRRLYGRGRFGRRTQGGPWTYHPRPGRFFRPINRPSQGEGRRPRAMPPWIVKPGHTR
jgi:hypothetical protein